MLECPAEVPLEKLHDVLRSESFEPCQPLQLGSLDEWEELLCLFNLYLS